MQIPWFTNSEAENPLSSADTHKGFPLAIIAIALLAGMVFSASCSGPRVPTQRVRQYTYGLTTERFGDTLRVKIENPLHCALRVWIEGAGQNQQAPPGITNPIRVPALADTVIPIPISAESNLELSARSKLGDPAIGIQPAPFSLPFPKGRSYQVIQGHNSTPTHNTPWSRYALDFSLQKADTVCAAADGYVVGVVEAYTEGGAGPQWKDFGNFITLYHPQNGLFTQYVHLDYQGSLVEVGDSVRAGEAIGLAGFTGQTNIQHLHFNALEPDSSADGLKSYPVDFSEGYQGEALKRGDTVIRPPRP